MSQLQVSPLLPTLALGLVGGLASAQQAQDLFVGGPNGVIQRGHPLQGGFGFLGVCGGPIQSMVADGEDLFIGDQNGNIYHYESATDTVDYSFTSSNDATSLVMHDGDLLVGGTDATVLRFDKVNGDLLDTLTAPVSVDSMLLVDGTLFVGSAAGVVHETDPDVGIFTFFGTCGGPVTSMAANATHLVLGTPSGVLYRLNFVTQLVDSTFTVDNDATAMVSYEGDLLVGGSDTTVLRVDTVDGTEFSRVADNFEIQAMALGIEPEPGLPYCYGIACPCGNDDERGGCVSSNGVGSLLRGVGTPSIADDDMVLTATWMAPNKPVRFYMGATQIEAPFGNGVRCAGAGAYGAFRFPVTTSGPGGFVTLGPGIVQFSADHFPGAGQIITGFTWHFQTWFRDGGGACGATFNTSNAYSVTFQP